MSIDELVYEIIYFCKYFKIIEVNNDYLMAKKITEKLENMVFINSLIERLEEEKRLKKFISFGERQRLGVLFIELENIKSMLHLDDILEFNR